MANPQRRNQGNQGRPQEAPYEQMRERYLTNLDRLEGFFYAHEAKKQGEKGQENALDASIWTFRNKIGLEGMLQGVRAEAMASIRESNGLRIGDLLNTNIDGGYETFLGSLGKLKINDLIPYITGRLEDVEIVEKFGDSTVESLSQRNSSNERKTHAAYITEQVTNAAMAKGGNIAYVERARNLTEVYKQGALRIS